MSKERRLIRQHLCAVLAVLALLAPPASWSVVPMDEIEVIGQRITRIGSGLFAFLATGETVNSRYYDDAVDTSATLLVAATRAPACLREQLAMREVQSQLAYGLNPGATVPMTLDDPLYNDGNWVKKSVVFIDRVTDPGGGPTTRYRIEIHYHLNIATNQVAQVKFKNTPEQGCVGQSVA